MREDWPIKSLTEIARVQTGKWDANHAKEDGEYRFYTCAMEFLYSETKRFEGECLILPGNGANVGEVFYYNGEFDAYQRTYVIDQIQEYPLYVYYYLKAFWREVNLDKQYGSATNYLKIGNFKDFKLPIPPLPEQKRIVEILDEAFEAIDQARANVERNIQNAEELFQSKLNEIFSHRGDGWEEKKLGDLTFVKSGGTPRRSTKEYWENGSIPWYSSGELNELYTTDSDDLITEKGLNESNAKLFPKGSLLIGMYDTAALKMSILDRDGTFNQAIAGAKPTDELNLQFVMHAINAIKPELMEQRRGVRQKNLNLTKIKAIPVLFPKIEIQNEVVTHLSELQDYTNTLANTYHHKVKNLEELKKSILQKAFLGELTANEHVAV